MRDHQYVHNSWSAHRPTHEVYRRAGGRRGYNRRRQLIATDRRVQIARRILRAGGLYHGMGAQLARELGVDRSTISRDINIILTSGSVGIALHWYGDN